MAEHYGVAVIPTRTAAPRDKAKAENGVLVAERWILARLRNRTFFSIGAVFVAFFALLAYVPAFADLVPYAHIVRDMGAPVAVIASIAALLVWKPAGEQQG